MKIQLKRSNQLSGGAAKEPTAAQMEYGELAVNYNTDDPVIFIKDSDDNIVRIAGSGAEAGGIPNGGTGDRPGAPQIGDLFYDIDLNSVLYWDGFQWVALGTNTIVQENPPSTNYAEGTLWFNSSEEEAALYILYDDPTPAAGKKWVQIAGGGFDDSVLDNYVLKQGDNITGALTIGPVGGPAVTTLANDGNAEFTGDVTADNALLTTTEDTASSRLRITNSDGNSNRIDAIVYQKTTANDSQYYDFTNTKISQQGFAEIGIKGNQNTGCFIGTNTQTTPMYFGAGLYPSFQIVDKEVNFRDGINIYRCDTDSSGSADSNYALTRFSSNGQCFYTGINTNENTYLMRARSRPGNTGAATTVLDIKQSGRIVIGGDIGSNDPNISLNPDGSAVYKGSITVDNDSNASELWLKNGTTAGSADGALLKFANDGDSYISYLDAQNQFMNFQINGSEMMRLQNKDGVGHRIALGDASTTGTTGQMLAVGGTSIFEDDLDIGADNTNPTISLTAENGNAQFAGHVGVNGTTNFTWAGLSVTDGLAVVNDYAVKPSRISFANTGAISTAAIESSGDNTAGYLSFITRKNGSDVEQLNINADGLAHFSGNVTSNGTIGFNLGADDPANYTTTMVDGVEQQVYSGPTLDVKDRLVKTKAALETLKSAAAASTDFASLKAAIATALADI